MKSTNKALPVYITVLLFLSTVINYMDRQNLSILARPTIRDMTYEGPTMT